MSDGGAEDLAPKNVGDGGSNDLSIDGGSDAYRDDGKIVEKVDGAIDRIDNPTNGVTAGVIVKLLANDGRARATSQQLRSDEALGLQVGVGDDIGRR